MYSAPCEMLLLNVKELKSLVMGKRKQPLDSMFQNPVPQAARVLSAVNALDVAIIRCWLCPGFCIISGLWSWPQQHPLSSQLLHPGVTPQLLTSGSLCSVQAALLDRAPSRWLQPDHTLRQLLDSWETHTNTTSVGCPTLASSYW